MMHLPNPHHDFIGAAMAAMARSRRLPRLFTLSYDCTKLKSKNPVTRAEFAKRIECEGTLYSNGRVTLDTGVMFRSLTEMEEHFEAMGSYTLAWLDEESHE